MDSDQFYQMLLKLFDDTPDNKKNGDGLEEEEILARLLAKGLSDDEVREGLDALYNDERGEFFWLGFYHEDRPWEQGRTFYRVFSLPQRMAEVILRQIRAGDRLEGYRFDDLLVVVRERFTTEEISEDLLREAIDSLTIYYDRKARWNHGGILVPCSR